MEAASLYKKVKIIGIKEETKGVKTFYLSTGDDIINYKAGQYLTFVINEGDGEVRRSYSITSSPILDEPLSIGVKRVENGLFSRLLIDYAKEGDELITTGAGGFFVLPQNIQDYKQIFFLAAGSGITPIYSLLKTALHAHPHLTVTLIYSNSSLSTTIFYEELQQLQNRFANRLNIEFLFSDAADLYRAHLHVDLLNSFLKKYSLGKKTAYYICGPLNYMRMCTYTLQVSHVPQEDIRKEDFIIQRPIIRNEPPDKEAHAVSLEFKNSVQVLSVQYPQTILAAAKQQRLQLPYSCEAGRCGNCAAYCTIGKVWMSNNEVLTEKDMADGLVLTCVGYPVEGDVHLKFV